MSRVGSAAENVPSNRPATATPTLSIEYGPGIGPSASMSTEKYTSGRMVDTLTRDDAYVGTDVLSELAAMLYALPPDEFVPARDAAAAEAKKAGDRTLAAAVGKLRKPTVGAWLVNLLAHERPDLVGQLLALGDQLRTAQRHLRGEELRELSQRRREVVSRLAREAGVLGRRHTRANLPLAEVEATLTAALAEPEVGDEVRAGRLTKTVSYAGFGEPPRPQLRLVQGGQSAAPVSEAAPGPADRAARHAEREAREAAERSEREAREVAEAEERRRAEERTAAEERRRAEEQLRRQRTAAHRELLAARTELAEAEAARTEAERAVTAARRRVQKATSAVRALGDE